MRPLEHHQQTPIQESEKSYGGIVGPVRKPADTADLEFPTPTGSERLIEYEFVDSHELARRLAVPTSWIREQVRSRSEDPLPHVHLGKYVRFLWGSPDLEEWVSRRIVKKNNRRVERVR